MRITPKEQAKNAIKWIDTLPSYPQAKQQRGKLGDEKMGFCCLGAGCRELGIDYHPNSGTSLEFRTEVGLKTVVGGFTESTDAGCYERMYYDQTSLTEVNDATHAGFKRIANLLKTHPEWMFKPEVAKLIRSHYEKT